MGCSALLGVKEIYLEENGVPGADGSTDGDTSTDGGPNVPDGAVLPDGTVTCNANLQTDNKNCGRCGRDCLGAACTEGMCEPITLAGQLTNPTGVALTATSVFVTSGPEDNGKILEVSKTPGGQPKTLVSTNLTQPWGLFVDGTTLYWADADFTYTVAQPTYRGGIWKCTLPACTNVSLVRAAEEPANPVLVDGFVYVAEQNASQLLRFSLANPQGPANTFSTGSRPFYAVADKTHVYGTSGSTNLNRWLHDGGGEEDIGPQASYITGAIVLDDNRYYWTYCDNANAGGGHVVSLPKANPAAQRIEYGTGNTVPRGIAVDATNVYWTNEGTYNGVSNADGDIRTCPKTGCPASGAIVLAKGLATPHQIAVDDSGIYVAVYTNRNQQTGQVIKIAKP